MTSAQGRHIVIVGGGFAGAAVASRLQRRLPLDWSLTLVSEESYTTFNPLLAEVVGASVFPEQVAAPLRQILRQTERTRFVMGRVSRIDVGAREIECSTLAGQTRLRYDDLVLAFGNLARLDFIPGLAEFALPLKTIGDAVEIRNAALRRLARIELEDDPALRASLGHFVVIGGGFSGVEVAGELVDCLKSVSRFYPRVRAEEIRITLIHDQAALLPELPAALGRIAEKSLRRRGADVRLGVRARSVTEDSVALDDGVILSSRCVIATAGVQANPLAAAPGLTTQRGRIVVSPDMRVAEAPGVWALGDCALVLNAQDGAPAPPTAQFAVREGRQLADNLIRAGQGLPTRAFSYRARGALASIGRFDGVAEVFGVCLSGLVAWLLWRGFYLLQMPTFGRKLRIWAEWTWGMAFAADITHLRFTRSSERS